MRTRVSLLEMLGVHLWAKQGHIWREISLCCLGWFTKEVWWLTPEISAPVKKKQGIVRCGPVSLGYIVGSRGRLCLKNI